MGRWREVVWTFALGFGFVALGVGRLAVTSPTWAADLRQNLADFTATGFADPSPANAFAWQMINLTPLVHRFADHGLLATAAVALLVIVSFGLSAHVARRDKPDATAPDITLGFMSLAAVLSLLVTYHRAYDAVLLLFPALWAWRRLVDHRCTHALITANAVAVFLIPGGAILRTAIDKGILPDVLRNSWLGGTFVMHHANWALLLLWVTLVLVLRRRASAPPGTASPK